MQYQSISAVINKIKCWIKASQYDKVLLLHIVSAHHQSSVSRTPTNVDGLLGLHLRCTDPLLCTNKADSADKTDVVFNDIMIL